jgi:hypothetical protein
MAKQSGMFNTSNGVPVSLPPITDTKLKTQRVSQHAPDPQLAAAYVQNQQSLGKPITWVYEENE